MNTGLPWVGGYAFGLAFEKWWVYYGWPDSSHWPATVATGVAVACMVWWFTLVVKETT